MIADIPRDPATLSPFEQREDFGGPSAIGYSTQLSQGLHHLSSVSTHEGCVKRSKGVRGAIR